MQGGFDSGEQIKSVARSAYSLGLKHKEAALRILKPEDGDVFFELSEQWREYLHNEQHCRELVLDCLKLDPDHPRGVRVAEERYKTQLEKYNGRWMTTGEASRLKGN